MKEVISISLLCIISLAMAQRSPYAPRPVGYPTMLEHFNTNAESANAGDTNDPNNLPNRFGGNPDDKGPLQPEPGQMGDPYLLPHLPQWPKEHQPFWYLNQQHIKDHQNQRVPPRNGVRTQEGVVLGNRFSDDGAVVLGSQTHQSPFVKRPIDRPGLGAQFTNNNNRQN